MIWQRCLLLYSFTIVFIHGTTKNNKNIRERKQYQTAQKSSKPFDSFSSLFQQDAKGVSLAGFLSWLIWRSAYLTRVVSWRNRFYVAVNWATTLAFGRDNSRI